MIISILLAAGKGTRLKSTDKNKVTIPFLNKPLIVYGVELLQGVTDKTVVVVGAFAESVKTALAGQPVEYALQVDQLGTAHAVSAGFKRIDELRLNPADVLICYGDHTMFYKKETVQKFIEFHKTENATVSLLTTVSSDASKLAWGRIIRQNGGSVTAIVEQKDATPEELLVTEINPGFYLVKADFLRKALAAITPSPVSGEYYITDIVKIAVQMGQKVAAFKVSFEEVGIGINKREEITESEKIYLESHSFDSIK